MNKIIYLLLIVLTITGCSIDNYDMPNAKLSGKVIDEATSELIENGGVNNGTRIQLFENDSNQPITSYCFPDGNFVNNALFQGNYRIVVIGAFVMVNEFEDITLKDKNDNVEISVIPNVRLKTTLLNNTGTSIEVKVEYSKVHQNQILDQIAVTWSTIDNPNIYTSYKGGVKIENVTNQNLTSGELIFTISGLESGKQYYIRSAARTNAPGGYYNYSKTISTQ